MNSSTPTTPGTPGTPGSPNIKLDGKTILIGIVIIIAALIILPRLFNTNSNPADNPSILNQPNNDVVPDDGITIGQPVAAQGVDRDGCPISQTSAFDATQNVYVVAPNTALVPGTEIYARLYFNNQAVEDSPAVVADQTYNNTCVNFVFAPTGGRFQPGAYEAEFIVNGNSAGSVSFNVQ